jgi:hypothetical protein
MNTRGRRLLLLTVLGVSAAALSRAADPPPFSIAINSPQDAWKLGADVRLAVILTNTSDRTIFFRKLPGQDDGERFMDVEVTDDRGNVPARTRYYRVLRHEDTDDVIWGGYVQKKLVKPGESLNDGMIVNRLFDLARPGKYTVRVIRRDEATKTLVMSNTITVTVSN